MGTWGTAIFSNDIASDVRHTYRGYIGDGKTGPEATDLLLSNDGYSIDGPDNEDTPFWLGLAITQWKCGRLENRVKEKTLRIIDNGTDLINWEHDPKAHKKRKAYLEKARELLLSPQPPEKRIPKRFKDSTDWQIGEVVSYRLRSGDYILFRVLDYHADMGGTCPLCELLDWSGSNVPGPDVINKLPVKSHIGVWKDHAPQFMLGAISKREFPKDRINRLNIISPRDDWKFNGAFMFLWRFLDEDLVKFFGLE